MWDLPGPGLEPMSPALAGVFLNHCTTREAHKRYFFIYFFIYLFMAVLGLRFCARALSSCGKWGPLFIAVRGASHYCGLSCCGTQAPDAQAQQLWLTGLVAPRHVGSSQTRARTRVPCTGRQILNHCATREARGIFYLDQIEGYSQAKIMHESREA